MYEAYFKFHDRPFLAAPTAARYFPASGIEQARKTLLRCIDRGEGAACIIGPPGTGKTLLCQIVAEEFACRFSVALLSGRLSSRLALFQAILYELRLPYRNMDEGELRLALLDHLEPNTQGNEGLLLIIDEAHTLPCRLMEEIRLISNLVRGGRPRVRVVLAGAPLLEERFASPKLISFSQRLSARCYLEALDSPETGAYVKSQIAAVGGDSEHLFDETALRAVFRATDGIPRLINQVCDHALILASLGGLRKLTNEAIDEAWADLQQLPAPWLNPQSAGEAHPIVEFGRLDDAHDEPSAIPFRPSALRPLGMVQPEQQLEAIAGQLAKMDDDFSATGGGTTEIELEFPEFGDPFSEQFAEEEVVLERFRNAAEIFARAPRVTSWEGQKLGPLLTPWVSIPPLTISAETSADPQVKMPAMPVQQEIEAQAETILNQRAPEVNLLIAATGRQAMASVEQGSTGQEAVVVVEEATTAGVSPRGSAPVRNGEFRRLFAKLRRG